MAFFVSGIDFPVYTTFGALFMVYCRPSILYMLYKKLVSAIISSNDTCGHPEG